MTAEDFIGPCFDDAWRPEPSERVSEWAAEHRILSSMSAEPGRWQNERVPHMVEIADCLSVSSPVRRVIVMKGSQIAGTETIHNFIGYGIHRAPGPILMVEPTVEAGKSESKERLTPMIESTPALHELVRDARARDSGNTILLKQFPGGVLAIVGANSAKGLRRMPVRYLLLDEVDAYPWAVGREGDPVSLAEKRTTNFPRRKILMISTPTVTGHSRIEKEYLASDQRRYFVPCPDCGHMDYLVWSNPPGAETHHCIRWNVDIEEGTGLKTHHPETARMVCSRCGAGVEERMKPWLMDIRRAEWRPTALSKDRRARSYHVPGLLSMLGLTWAQCATEFLDVCRDPVRFQPWVNTVLGETWEERPEIEAIGLSARLESWPADVPDGVGVLVAGVDTQDDRLEAVVLGFGAREECWVISYHVAIGDPAQDHVWFEMEKFLKSEFVHQSGQKMRVKAMGVDTAGHRTEAVYRFCRARAGRGVFALRGGSSDGKPLIASVSARNRYGLRLYTLCTSAGKETIYSRLKMEAPRVAGPSPGRIHLREGVCDEEYLAQLTAERPVRKYVRSRGWVKEWVPIRPRNEALDTFNYALAALYILGPGFVRTLPGLATGLSVKPESIQKDGPGVRRGPPASTSAPRRGWLNSWKR